MKTGFIFPGQGSQSVGMLAELAKNFDLVKSTYTEASDVLGYDLWNLVAEGPESELNQTQRTQPALLAAGVAVWRVINQVSAFEPESLRLAGHSLGEYSALVCAGAIEFSDAITLVAARGQYMQEAVPEGEGAMAAILGLNDDEVTRICAEVSDDSNIVTCANYNSPGQIVIAGTSSAVDKAIEALQAAGAKRAMQLPVSVPSHCPLMQPAAEKLEVRLSETTINRPQIPVLHNVDAEARSDPEGIRLALIEQLYQPVRWVDVMQAMAKDVECVLESGPGKVLAGLSKRIDRKLPCFPVFDPVSLEKALA